MRPRPSQSWISIACTALTYSQETQVELSPIKSEETGQGFTSTQEAALTGKLDTNELMRQERALGGGVAMLGGVGGRGKVRQL